MSDIENKIPCKLDAATEQRMVHREQDCAPAGTVSEGEMAIWLYKAIPSISSADCDRIARALLSQFDVRRK